LLGAVSGAIATGILIALPENWRIEISGFLILSPLSIVAGLVFGILVGGLLGILGLASNGIAVLYAAASTVSYFVAVNLALILIDPLESIWLTGVIAGLVGAACLTAAAALLLPVARRGRPCALMVAVGALLGALLVVPLQSDSESLVLWFALFVPWQAGYAAAFATALPAAGSER
jgi:hypothetical protein